MSETGKKKAGEPTFEEALSRLEATVGKMEAGDLPLDKAIKAFEEGMTLAKFCGDLLGQTEKKVEVLMQKMGEEPQWQETKDDDEE